MMQVLRQRSVLFRFPRHVNNTIFCLNREIHNLRTFFTVRSLRQEQVNEFWKTKESESEDVPDNLVQFAMSNDFQFLPKVDAKMLLNQQFLFIDVRSPNEYAKDHIPNSINLPVLNNEERAHVGSIYAESSHRGKVIGAQLICNNIATILENNLNTLFSKENRKTGIVMYCSRGQQRSQSFATVLSRIGFRVFVIQGGYKQWRKQISEEISNFCKQFLQEPNKIVKIQSKTGCGKSLLLEKLHQRNEQGFFVLDIENAARHFGSLLGEYPVTHAYEPGTNFSQNEYFQFTNQRQFETNLYYQIVKQQHLWRENEPNILFLESESNRIGTNSVPYSLLQCIKTNYSILVTLQASLQSRVNYIRHIYKHFEENPVYRQILLGKLEFLKKNAQHLKPSIDIWNQWIEKNENWDQFVTEILLKHYDIVYNKSHHVTNSNPKHDSIPTIPLEIESISEEEMQQLATILVQKIKQFI